MNERQKLTEALGDGTRTGWRTAALSTLDDQRVVFGGSPGGARSTARDLLRIYRIKLAHCDERRILTHGMAELIESLARESGDTTVEVQYA